MVDSTRESLVEEPIFDINQLGEDDIVDPKNPIWMANSSDLKTFIDLQRQTGESNAVIEPYENRLKVLMRIHDLDWRSVWEVRDSITQEYFRLGTTGERNRQQPRYINLQAVFATCNERINCLNKRNEMKLDPSPSTPEIIPRDIPSKKFESGLVCNTPENLPFCALPGITSDLLGSLFNLGIARGNEAAAQEQGDSAAAAKYHQQAEEYLAQAQGYTFEVQLCFEFGVVCENCHVRNVIPPDIIKSWENQGKPAQGKQ